MEEQRQAEQHQAEHRKDLADYRADLEKKDAEYRKDLEKKDLLIEKLWRDVKALDIVEGTGQIQRLLIARRLVGHGTEDKGA